MREIQLTQGKKTIVDDDDYEKLSKHRWYLVTSKSNDYAQRLILGSRKYVSLHREIMCAPRSFQVDHINTNGLDNRKSNLRLCTPTQNQRNKRKDPGTSSKFKGVCIDKSMKRIKRWKASIRDGRLISLGYFLTQEEAAAAYDRAAKNLFGEFARTNEMEGLF